MFEDYISDERGLSPVFAAILLIGLVAILFAVIGGLVTDSGSDVAVAPTAQISASFDTTANNITLSHESGDDINPDAVEIEYQDSSGTSETQGFNDAIHGNVDGLYQGGDEVVVDVGGHFSSTAGVESGGEVTVRWVGENGDQNQALLEEIVP